MQKLTKSWWPIVVFGALGCGDPLVDPQAIADMRVLGARAEVVGDPARATPRPGETIRVEFLVAGPDGDIATSYAFTGCEAAESSNAPVCLNDLAALSAEEPTVDIPRLDMTVPEHASRVSVHGIVCDGASPMLGASVDEHRCAATARKGTPTWLDVYVQNDDAGNGNPSWTRDAITLDGQLWRAERANGCSLSVPGDGANHSISLGLAGMRDADEPLIVSHYVTTGTLERHYTVIEADVAEADARAEISWRAPGPSDRTSVSFYFVARDERGGVDWIRRELCLSE